MGEETPQTCFLLIKRRNIPQNVVFKMLTFVRFCVFFTNVVPYFYVHPNTSLISFYQLVNAGTNFKSVVQFGCGSALMLMGRLISKYITIHENCIFNICMLHTLTTAYILMTHYFILEVNLSPQQQQNKIRHALLIQINSDSILQILFSWHLTQLLYNLIKR